MSFWDNLDVYSSTNPASTFLKPMQPVQPAIKVNVPFKAGLDINSPVPSATQPTNRHLILVLMIITILILL